MVEEKDIFHLHKNRLFIDRLVKVVQPPLTTKQILTKVEKEIQDANRKVENA